LGERVVHLAWLCHAWLGVGQPAETTFVDASAQQCTHALILCC
jgi:hypothetical protein